MSTEEDSGYLHEYGLELTGGKVSVDHSSFTTTVSIHGGRKAIKKHNSVALLDSGSPSSFVTQAVIDEMLRRGAGSADIITVGKPRRWGGFTDETEPLQTNSSAYLSVQLFKGKKADGTYDSAIPHCSSNGFTAWFAVRKRLVFEISNRTYATLPKEAGRPAEGYLP